MNILEMVKVYQGWICMSHTNNQFTKLGWWLVKTIQH